jgi:radical SAM protein with 4Fe4S-binding SPASM domain
LYGCGKVLNWMYVGIEGDCFICHHDYYQREVYGNIKQGEINDILISEAAQLLRKRVFGVELAPNDFICRKCFEMDENKILSRFSKKIRANKINVD